MLQIGKYTPAQNGREASIERAYYGQGFIMKDEEAYVKHPDKVCYVPELSDAAYTHNDLLRICDGQEALARACFDGCDWQHPETWYTELFSCCGWVECPTCNRVFDAEATQECPFCHAIIDPKPSKILSFQRVPEYSPLTPKGENKGGR